MDAKLRNRIVEDAARWYARLQSSSCSAEDRAAFESWLAADTAHAQAYVAAEALADSLPRMLPLSPRLAAMANDALVASDARGARRGRMGAAAGSVRRRHPRTRVARAAVAASFVLAVLGTLLVREALDVAPAQVTTFRAADAVRDVTLEDGTRVQLDVGAELEVRFAATARRVTLTRGRAIFHVAHDTVRPFTVAAGKRSVTALGTVFQVEHTRSSFVVTLAEGSVAVTDDAASGRRTERLAPGEELEIVASANWVRRDVDTATVTSWSSGRHLFRSTPLEEAVEDINRYAAVKLRIADPTLADLEVSGSFLVGDGAAIAAAFEAVLPVRVAEAGKELLLFRRLRAPDQAVDARAGSEPADDAGNR